MLEDCEAFYFIDHEGVLFKEAINKRMEKVGDGNGGGHAL